jgi:hypothetical protein
MNVGQTIAGTYLGMGYTGYVPHPKGEVRIKKAKRGPFWSKIFSLRGNFWSNFSLRGHFLA